MYSAAGSRGFEGTTGMDGTMAWEEGWDLAKMRWTKRKFKDQLADKSFTRLACNRKIFEVHTQRSYQYLITTDAGT